jgi:flagellar biosynthesis chaperone FliJ
MVLQNDRELADTRDKLRLLEESYEEVRQETNADDELRAAELESLRRFINQLKEEISRYEAHQAVRR